MNEKEMIEEMARIMCGNDCEECAKETAEWRGVSFEKAKAEQCLTKKQAELLYEQGYRKIPEGSVVLDRQEHQKYCAYKIIEPQIKGCLDRERELEKQVAELEDKIENGTLIDMPRIIHPNKAEWYVQYQYPSGVIQYYICFSEAEAEAKLKELKGE